MKNFYLILLITILSCKTANTNGQQSQVNKKAEILYNQAVQYSFERKNDLAITTLQQAIKIEPTYLDANLKLAEIYQRIFFDYKKAIAVYEKIESITPENYLAIYNKTYCYFQVDDFLNAEKYGKKFLASEFAQGEPKRSIEQMLRNIAFSKTAIKNPVNVEFKNLGATVNSINDEYFPSVTSDNEILYFTQKQTNDTYPNEDIYVSEKQNGVWSKASKLGSSINSEMNEGAHCISASGKYLLFASDNYKNGNEGRIDIFIAKKQGNDWLTPANMGRNINTRSWDSQPVLSADSKQLFFVSDKKGGKGGSDIYVSNIAEDKKFGEATNLSTVLNTPFDEQRPYLHPDGKTMYFSSDGHPGFGGKDLFKSTLGENGIWSEPINLGYPINTKGDEFGIFVSADGQTAYISSDREGGFGGQDLYSFEMPEHLKPEKVSFVKGIVSSAKTNEAVLAIINIYDLETGTLYGSFSSDKVNGSFLSTILGGKNYAFEAEAKGFLPFSENVSLKDLKQNESFDFDIKLEPFAIGKEFVMKNIFFKTGEYELLETSKVELDYLVNFLTENATIKLEIGGHTDNVGSSSSNQILSEKRAESVKKYLILKGIENLRLSSKGYGDTKPMLTNDSEINKAKNRRTSFKIVG